MTEVPRAATLGTNQGTSAAHFQMRGLGSSGVVLALCLLPAARAFALRPPPAWDVVLHRDGSAQTLRVPEGVAVLHAAEAAGLLPGSDCRRGRCFSCAARVRTGSPWSLRVADDSALCEEAHVAGVVLLCSAYVCGPGLELDLDYEGLALDIQYRQRWERDARPAPPLDEREPTPHFRMPGDLVPFLERCRLQRAAEADKSPGSDS